MANEDAVLKALDGTAGKGDEMLPEEVRNEIIEIVREKSWVRQTIPTIEMSMSTVKIPKLTGSITFYGVSDSATSEPSESTHSTDDVQLDMKTIMGKVPIKKKLLTYAIPSLEAELKNDIGGALAQTEANVVVNGDTDTTASNINGTLSTGDVRLELDGLRKHNFTAVAAGSVTNVDASGAALGLSDIRKAIANLGVYGRYRDQLILLVSPTVGAEMLGWDELETIDKYPEATIVTGQVGKVYGISVIVTDAIPENLNDSGKYDGTTTDKTVAILFNKNSPILGVPTYADRKFNIQVEEKPGLDQINLYPMEDIAFNVRYQDAIVQIINISVA